MQWGVLLSMMLILFIATVWIWAKLWNNRRQLAKQQRQQQTDLIASIKIIASAILSGRLELIEGCNRLVPILNGLSSHWRDIPALGVISHLEQIDRLQKQPDQAEKLLNLCQDADLPHKLQTSEVQRALNWLLQHNQTGYVRVLDNIDSKKAQH